MRLPALAVVAVVLAALLGGCGSEEEQSLADVEVSGAPGTRPAVEFEAPLAVTETETRVLRVGHGPRVALGDQVQLDYLAVNAGNGKVFDSSHGVGVEPVAFTLTRGTLIPGFIDGLVGQQVGSRILLAVPPKDGFGASGNPQAGIGPKDTLLFVLDIRRSVTVLDQAEGTAVTPEAGLPTVALDEQGIPVGVEVPAAPPPDELVVQPLVEGRGGTVQAGDRVTVHYLGATWPGGETFERSWAKNQPFEFTLGEGAVIEGWDRGLTGQSVGSRLLLVVPADLGYGSAGQPAIGIEGGDTLVFVVDILAAG